jgi:hypothetical protein
MFYVKIDNQFNANFENLLIRRFRRHGIIFIVHFRSLLFVAVHVRYYYHFPYFCIRKRAGYSAVNF